MREIDCKGDRKQHETLLICSFVRNVKTCILVKKGKHFMNANLDRARSRNLTDKALEVVIDIMKQV